MGGMRRMLLAALAFVAVGYLCLNVPFGLLGLGLYMMGFPALGTALAAILSIAAGLWAAVYVWRAAGASARQQSGQLAGGLNVGVRALFCAATFVTVSFVVGFRLGDLVGGLLYFLGVPMALGAAVSSAISFTISILAAYLVWRATSRSGIAQLGAALIGALLGGGIGFLGGFFGPIYFAPDANQGPLLGIFITGPLGFLIGGLLGAAWWRRGGGEELGQG